MKIDMKHNRTSSFFLLAVLCAGLLVQPVSAETWANLYVTDHFGDSDDGWRSMDWYADLLGDYHLKVKKGLCDPLPEEVPSHLDTNGNWGVVGAGFQLSLRFQKPEFRVGEPVVALIHLRNVSSLLEGVFVNTTASPRARKNFSFELRQAEKTNQWNWTNAPMSEWVGNPGPRYLPVRIPRGTQHYFAVRVDGMFELKKAGDYSIKAIWPVRAAKPGIYHFNDSITNQVHISTGFAKFRIVEKP